MFLPRCFRLLAVCSLLAACAGQIQAITEDPNRFFRSTAARTPEEERRGFHVPEGFEVQLFADDTQIGGKPINIAFDARGRLWVSSTQEYPFPVKKEKWSSDTTRATGSKDSIRILQDSSGSGRADKVTVFANDLNIPTGLLPYKNGCVAWSIPNVFFLQDTKHEGRAEQSDQRRILFGPLGYERDTHGMISNFRLGLDGWIYATHGFSNTSHFQVLPQNKNPQSEISNPQLDITSGSIFRFRADGSEVQRWTNGQVNPFGICWDSWDNLYSADCHSNPITQIIRGATYPQFGKTTDPLGFGPVMCSHAHGSTGIAGIVYIDGGIWGPEWNDHMFIGNPVTSKINHDHITFTGTSPLANEEPDFITSDDPWFRPVDLQIGPDGAMYIADFYAPIIAHYEVPLDHPGRDRKSGRIWRVVRKGGTRKLPECDLTTKTTEDLLVTAKQDINVSNRHLACVELINRGQLPDGLSDAISGPAGLQASGGPRAKVQAERRFATAILDAPKLESLSLLLDDLQKADKDDAHLKLALRIALRTVLEQPGAYAALGKLNNSAALHDELIRISLAVPTEDAAGSLLSQISETGKNGPPLEHGLLSQCFTHIARHLPAQREGELLELVQRNFVNDLDTQIDLFFAVLEGQKVRDDGKPNARTQQWASDLAVRLLDVFSKAQVSDWNISTPPTTANPSPWFTTRRKCADGLEAEFLDSHPPGGEKLTGTMRSKPFPMPESFTFWIAGHRGPPGSPPHEKNVVRLLDAASGQEISRAYPPRNDVAGRVTWLCGGASVAMDAGTPAGSKMPSQKCIGLGSEVVGRQVCLEAVDGDSGTAYAWLALGRFDPPVLTVPDLKSTSRDHRVLALARLCAPDILPNSPIPAAQSLRGSCLTQLAKLPDKASLPAETRLEIATALSSSHNDKLARLLAPLVKEPDKAGPWLDALSDPDADLSTPLAKLFKTSTHRQQVDLAELLTASREGSETLLKLAPPTVLAEPLVSSKIKALGDASLTERLTKLTAALPPQNAAVNDLIAQRLQSFEPSKADQDRGKQVFTQTCIPCHRIGILGNLVGPQLDGIGQRGPARLLEDILDPNREVDPAFRLHILKLKNDSVLTGLVRREQDGAVVYADVTGQEHSVPKADVAADDVSPFSLMPSGFGEVLTEQQLHDLLAFLLERK